MTQTGKSSLPGWLVTAIFLLVGLGMLGGGAYNGVSARRQSVIERQNRD